MVPIPPGRWLGDEGELVSGPSERTVGAPLSGLPQYRRIE